MKTRNLIPITNHPKLPAITRKAQVRRCDNHYEAGTAEMVLNIFNYLDGVEIKEMERQVSLAADNAMINPDTFNYVEADENGNYPEGSVGEYDYLYTLIESGTKTQFELEEMFINLRIETINKKLYNL